VWQILSINLIVIDSDEIYQHISCYFLPFDLFGSYSAVYHPSELYDLLHKLWSQLIDIHRIQFLKLFLVGERSNESEAPSIFEGTSDRMSDFVSDLRVSSLSTK
jgi:hypothetical protein